MDYLKQSFTFKARKVLRYLAMYGPRRTYLKILGQQHMRRTYASLPPQLGNQKWYHAIGMIGCGNYAYSTIAYFLKKEFGDVIGACMDKDINRAASFASRYKVPRYSDNADDVIKNPDIRLIYIASNHASHAEYAIEAMAFGKDVYIEKPHVVTLDQLHRLHAAMRKFDRKVFLGFNRPGSRYGRLIAEALSRETGPSVMNWFVIGQYLEPDHWYHNSGEGGRVLGNLCHWTDFVFGLVSENAFPLSIIPARWESSDSDMAVSFVFADGTIAAITFSSQGQTFEGVRESFRAQKGNTIISMDDFKTLKIEIAERKIRHDNFYHDHGHRQNIIGAYKNSLENDIYHRDKEMSRVLNTAWIFLNTKNALERNERLIINSFEQEYSEIFTETTPPKSASPRHRPLESVNKQATRTREGQGF